MSNAFDTSNAQAGEPVEIYAGDYTAWKRTDLSSDYPPASYTLKYECRSEGTPSRNISLTATEDNGDFLIEITSVASAAFLVANYHWSAYIERISDQARVTIDTGIFTVLTNKAEDDRDPRSHALKMLAHIEAALLHRAENYQIDILDYSMGETSASRDTEKLLKHREYWKKELVKANRKARARKGLNHSAQIGVKF